MPRGDHTPEGEPLRTWFVQVDDANRVRVGQEVFAVVSWLKSGHEPIECVGMPGPAGGLQIEPVAVYEEDLRRFRQSVGDRPPTARESGQAWMDVARLLATAWRLPVNIEASRISITLPEPARRSLLVPGAGGVAVVFGYGEILEVWDGARWIEHLRRSAGRKTAALSEAIEDLKQR